MLQKERDNKLTEGGERELRSGGAVLVWSPPRFMLIGWDLGTVLWKNRITVRCHTPWILHCTSWLLRTLPLPAKAETGNEHSDHTQKLHHKLVLTIHITHTTDANSQQPVPLPTLLSHGFRTDYAPAAYQQTSSTFTGHSQRAKLNSATCSREIY
jgi:hypothetical protein